MNMRSVVILSLFVAVTTLVLSGILIELMGTVGVGIAWCISQVTTTIIIGWKILKEGLLGEKRRSVKQT